MVDYNTIDDFWKVVQGYESYLINRNGEIKTSEEYRKTYTDKDGYKIVFLKGSNKKHDSLRVHRLVAMNFIPNPDNKPQVNHKNGIKDDNRVENLEWVTPSENIKHAYKHNLITNEMRKVSKPKLQGEKHPKAKLTKEDVLKIRRVHDRNSKEHTSTALAEVYNVSPAHIRAIVSRKRWKNI